eukprot:5834850-Prymnesium_polylepis.1
MANGGQSAASVPEGAVRIAAELPLEAGGNRLAEGGDRVAEGAQGAALEGLLVRRRSGRRERARLWNAALM